MTSLRVEVHENYARLSQLAAAIVARMIRQTPDAVLGLPTGSTPEGLYVELARRPVSLARVRTFNLDEYLGLPRSHPQSYHYFMKSRLFDHMDLRPEFTHIPDGTATDPEAECRRYEEAIRKVGGLDVVILGLGHNGHIGFNEPGTPWDSRTRPVELTQTTREANARFFGSLEAVARWALTMGIGTLLEARKILLLAYGPDKAAIVQRVLEEEPSQEVPATALQFHPDVTVLLDRTAAKAVSSSGIPAAPAPGA